MSDSSLQPFSRPALERIAKIIAERYTGSEITDFFCKAGFPQVQHNGSTKWRFVYEGLQALQSGRDGPWQIAKVLQELCDPQHYFGHAEEHTRILSDVNEILGFYGLLADSKTGKVALTGERDPTLREPTSEDEKLFDARTFHPEVRRHARQLFLEGRHFHAVFESCKAFDKNLAAKSALDSHGTTLAGSALSLRGPLKLNRQETETERNEQEGLMHLCMGLMRAIRNPESHEPELDWPISKEDALDILSLLSYLYRQVDKAVYYGGD